MNNFDLRQNLRNRKEALEIRQAFALDLLGLVVPLAAPLVPAYLTATAIMEHYPSLLHIEQGWVNGMAFIAGAVIEVLGILSIETMFDMRTFNATVQEGEEKAPFEWAAGAVAFYLILVITLVLLLKIWSTLALWSLAPLTVLGFVTSWVMVLRKQHNERVWKRDAADAEQSEIEQLNAEIKRISADHAAALNAERERIERLESEHTAAIEHERNRNEHLENELAALRAKIERLAEQRSIAAIEQPTPKPKRKAAGKAPVDPERIHRYFEENGEVPVRQASEDLGYSIGSIQRYKPALNGNGHKEPA